MGEALKSLAGRLAFRHLRMIVAIADAGNLVGAAAALNMTQSAVTKALQEVEALLRTRLFDRTNRGAVPTVAGMALIGHARLILAQLRHAEEHLADLRDGTGGRVVVGTLLSASASLLPRAIVRLRAARTRIDIKVVEATNDVLMPLLRSGELDLVVGRLSEHRETADVEQEALFPDQPCVVCRAGHPLTRLAQPGPADLTGWDWILPPPDVSLRRQLDVAFRQAGVAPPRHAVESVSLLTNRALLQAGDYLAVLPLQAGLAEAATGALVILPLTMPTVARPVGITRRAGSTLSPATETFLRVLREVSEEMQAQPQPVADCADPDGN